MTLIRRKPLVRVAPPKRSGKPRAVNRKRKAREWTRAYGSPERVAFVAALPCVVSGCVVSPCENAHTSGDGGAGRKASARYVIPACAAHHHEQHTIGAGTFALKYQLNLRALAAAVEAAWQARTT